MRVRSILAAVFAVPLLLVACGPAAPSADAPEGAGGDAAPAEFRYTCGDPVGFLPSLLDQPATAETEDHPSAAALRAALADPGPDFDLLPDTGWWLIVRDDDSAEYVARRGVAAADPPFASASFMAERGAWKIAGWGDCRPTAVMGGLSVATWVLDPNLPPPGPEATQITALVTERSCTGGQEMGARLRPPSITYTDDAVLVVFTAQPLQGDAFTCQANPPTRVVFELREPLGDRQLLDAAFFPPVEPVEPAS